MKAERNYPRYTVTAKAEAAILRGHPWVYDAEITATEGQAENGGLVDVINKKGRYLGTGFLSEQSKIRVRLVSRSHTPSTTRAVSPSRMAMNCFSTEPGAEEAVTARERVERKKAMVSISNPRAPQRRKAR